MVGGNRNGRILYRKERLLEGEGLVPCSHLLTGVQVLSWLISWLCLFLTFSGYKTDDSQV